LKLLSPATVTALTKKMKADIPGMAPFLDRAVLLVSKSPKKPADKQGLSTGAKVGIGVAVGAVVLGGVAAAVMAGRRHKARSMPEF
jgi:hypothetical protein